MQEVGVACEDGEVQAGCYRADEKICVRTLDALRPATVAERRRFLEVVIGKVDVRERAEILPKAVELRAFLDPGQDFLSYGADHRNPPVRDQRRELRDPVI